MRTTDRTPMPEQIRVWVSRHFREQDVDRVTLDLVNVATGNRPGNTFERSAIGRIFPDSVFGEEGRRYCEGCDAQQEGVRDCRVKFAGRSEWETVRYCPDCYDLATINFNGETDAIEER